MHLHNKSLKLLLSISTYTPAPAQVMRLLYFTFWPIKITIC